MITVKNPHEIALMRQAGAIAKRALLECGRAIAPGVTTERLDEIALKVITEAGATPSFLNYHGFPKTICCSVNRVVIHGIPSGRKIADGDIVSIDVGAIFEGYHGDCAATFPCGSISEEAERLIGVTRQSFYEGIARATAGNRVSDISNAIEDYVVKNGFSIVREFVGHGIGRKLHEEPEVPNYFSQTKSARLVPGMTLAIEPMVNQFGAAVVIAKDGWTVNTVDGGLSAHYENTILITNGKPEILTASAEETG